MEEVVLVDPSDRQVGTMEKLEAHRKGLLHRAISVFVFNSKGELLLQKRASTKYHGGGLWTNTCCSHPRVGENPADAVKRRLKEEMGIDCHPVFSHTFLYKADVGQGLTEHELDHVFTAIYDGAPIPDPTEAEDWRYIDEVSLKEEVARDPEKFSAWIKIILNDKKFRFRGND